MGLFPGGKILAAAYLNRCRALSHQAKLDVALSDCNEAISLNPEFAVSYNNRGMIWFRLGDFERAIEDFNATIKLNPGAGRSVDKSVWRLSEQAGPHQGYGRLQRSDLYESELCLRVCISCQRMAHEGRLRSSLVGLQCCDPA
jgi:tetratricopeptide (TPR) repeat protein